MLETIGLRLLWEELRPQKQMLADVNTHLAQTCCCAVSVKKYPSDHPHWVWLMTSQACRRYVTIV